MAEKVHVDAGVSLVIFLAAQTGPVHCFRFVAVVGDFAQRQRGLAEIIRLVQRVFAAVAIFDETENKLVGYLKYF